jgi:NAD(P)-dependent dehydrogenase (short-subunit alcohol dehydrogenase family)
MAQQTFQGKVALVTGGTSGIGKAAALAFAKAGARVAIAGRREAEGNAVASEIRDAGGHAIFVRTDVTRETDVKTFIDTTVREFGRLDVAFNNAGVEWMGSLTEASEADYRRIFDTNLWSVVASLKHEIPAMLRSGGGSIVNTSSVAGQVGMAGVTLYTAAKHAVEGLTKSAALEFAKQGIRVNAIAPAAISTDMVDRFVGKEGKQREHLGSLHPIGRMGRPEEVAAAVLYLASSEASFITGTTLAIDGGWLAQ